MVTTFNITWLCKYESQSEHFAEPCVMKHCTTKEFEKYKSALETSVLLAEICKPGPKLLPYWLNPNVNLIIMPVN